MKFLLLVAVAGLASLASANIQVPGLPGVLGLPKVPGLPNLLPVGKRDVTDSSAGLFKNPDFINGFVGLLQQFGGEILQHISKHDVMAVFESLFNNRDFTNGFVGLLQQFGGHVLPHLSKRDLSGLLSGAQSLIQLPVGWATDLAAGGKMSMDGIKNDLGKRSILDETHDVQKREIVMDLLNKLIGNFEGTMTGMDIGR